MAKRLSEEEKKVIFKCFTEGKTIDELAEQFFCTKVTIVRNLKINLGKEKFKELLNQNKKVNKSPKHKELSNSENNNCLDKINIAESTTYDYSKEELLPIGTFTEIVPLNYDIENTIQKDLSSVPISDVDFPKIVYMIVNKNIELETKFLKEYPEWQFLPQEELNRKTIEIYLDIKIAKRFCNKEQKVIKVPNTNVFKITASLLLNKGISRIISSDKLIAL